MLFLISQRKFVVANLAIEQWIVQSLEQLVCKLHPRLEVKLACRATGLRQGPFVNAVITVDSFTIVALGGILRTLSTNQTTCRTIMVSEQLLDARFELGYVLFIPIKH